MGHNLLGPTVPGSVSPMIKSSESDLKSDAFDSSVGRLQGFEGQSLEVVLRCVAEPHLHIFVCTGGLTGMESTCDELSSPSQACSLELLTLDDAPTECSNNLWGELT